MEIDQIPTAIRKFIDASNKLDPEAFVNCFSEDAVVLDEGTKRIGQKAIKHGTLELKAVKGNKDEVVVTCKLDGTYDKTGLPDPLLLEYHFSIVDDKIVSLSIF